jgi:hypothetical protein
MDMKEMMMIAMHTQMLRNSDVVVPLKTLLVDT